MNNISEYQRKEKTIWEYLKLIFQNWIWIISITVFAAAISLVYSFVFEPKEEIQYNFQALVIYDEWNYYPPGIHNAYATELSEYIGKETGERIFSSVILSEINPQDNKEEFKLHVTYLSTIDPARVPELNDIVINWHNSMIVSEFEKIINNKNKLVEDLLEEYTQYSLAYASYLEDNPTNQGEEGIKLAAMRDISFELLEEEKFNLNNLYKDFATIDSYYADPLYTYTSTVAVTWKSNLIVACIMGVFVSLVFILGKDSYQNYKKSKQTI